MSDDTLSPTSVEDAPSADKAGTQDFTTNEAIIGGNHIKRMMLPENDLSLKRIIMVYKPEEDKFITKLDFSGTDKEDVIANAQIVKQAIQEEGV